MGLTKSIKKNREIIMRRLVKEVKDGMVANLGVGVPCMLPSYLPEGVDITL